MKHPLIILVLTLCVFTNCQSQTNHNCSFPYNNHQPEDLCGYIDIPQNWDKNTSKATKLGYLVIRSKSENRKEDPVVFLQGGPGGSVLSLADIYGQINLDSDRDFILYDQRGIGFSEELCPNLNLQLLDIMAQDLTIDKEITALKESIESCTNFIKSDERQFSTTTNAKDLEALRQHLGYKQLNLFGGSYGTRLGLKYMELYPDKVRSAVLSGLFPPEIRMYDYLFSNFNNALNKVFESCEKDGECQQTYPNLRSEFINTYAQLKTNPITIKLNGNDFILNQQDILLFMHQMLYNNKTIERIPKFIKALTNRDKNHISSTIGLFLPRITLINLAVYYSIMTADEGSFNNQQKINKDSKGLLVTDTGLSLFSADPEIIKGWPSIEVKSNHMQRVNSSIPTLLVSGDFDPVTPPNNATIVANSLSNDQHLIFKNNGHVPINGCFFSLAKQFLNDPIAKLNSNCSSTSTVLDWD